MIRFFRGTTFLAVVACLLWSSAFVGIKIGLQYTTPLQFAGIRFMLAGILILPFCGDPLYYLKSVIDHRGTVALVAFFQTTLLYALFYQGINMVPGAIAAIVVGSQPLIIAVIAHFIATSERMTVRRLISILLGLTGVVVIGLTRGEITLQGGSQFLGLVLLLASNVSSGLGNIIVSRNRAPIAPLTLTSSQLFLGGLCLFLLSLPTEGIPGGSYPAAYYASLLWLSFLSAAAFSIWFKLLKREGVAVSDLNIWKFLIPVSGACLSWLLIPKESPELSAVIGMVLIAAALIVLNTGRSRQRKQ
jgi:drug/metabolite transporter (DMT)-like permease